MLVPHKRGDNPFYSVLILKKNFVNNQKTFPKEYVIPEADEGGNQESPTSVTVHSNKPLVNGSVRDPCFRRDDPSSGESFVNNQKTFPKEYVIPEADEGGYQESLFSVTVNSSKANCHPSFCG